MPQVSMFFRVFVDAILSNVRAVSEGMYTGLYPSLPARGGEITVKPYHGGQMKDVHEGGDTVKFKCYSTEGPLRPGLTCTM